MPSESQDEALELARKFYEANATTTINVPRPGHPEDKSGWDGVRRASEARFIAPDALVMTLPDAFEFAEKFAGVSVERERRLTQALRELMVCAFGVPLTLREEIRGLLKEKC